MNLQDVDPKQLLLALRQASRELKSENFSRVETPFGFSHDFNGHYGPSSAVASVCAYVDMWPQQLIFSSPHLDAFWIDSVHVGQRTVSHTRIHAPLWEKMGPIHFDPMTVGQVVTIGISFIPPREKYEVEEWEWIREKGRKKHVVKKVTKERGVSATLSGVLLCRLRESSFTDE